MKILKVLVGLIGLTSGIMYLTTQEAFYFSIFLAFIPVVWGFAAYDEWKAGRKFTFVCCAIAALFSFILAGDLFLT